MLRSMSVHQFLDWQAYAQVEPFGEWWATRRTAAVMAQTANMRRERRKPYDIDDFILELKDTQPQSVGMTGKQVQAAILAAYGIKA